MILLFYLNYWEVPWGFDYETCHRQRTGGSSFSQFTDIPRTKSVDDYQYGGVWNGYDCTAWCLYRTQWKARELTTKLFICRQTGKLEPKMANSMSMYENIIICADIIKEWISVRDHFITKEISIGDYVLSEVN
jgi:tRNA G37 N-methylase TrmD